MHEPLVNFPNPAGWWCKHWEFTSDEDLTEWVVTAVAGGGCTVIDTKANGCARILALATTDNCGAEVQLDAGVVALAANKIQRWLFRGVQVSESTSTNSATESDSMIGAATIDTSLLASAPTNCIWLFKADGATTWDLVVRKGGVAVLTYTTNFSFVAGTDYNVAFEIAPNAAGSLADITVYVNGTAIATAVNVAAPFLSDGVMAPCFTFQTGDNTGTKWFDVSAVTVAGMI